MLMAALAMSACGGGATSTSTTAARSPAADARASHAAGGHAPPARPATFVYHPRYQLPAPLKDPAFAVLGAGRFALLGGLDSSEISSAGIEIADAAGVLHTGRLPLAQHDAQGAELGGEVYVFGGGSATELDHIISFDPARGAVSTVGALPRAQSDVTVAAAGDTAYVVGGYDGTNWLNTILAWRPGSPVRVAGHLPVGLRYAAAAAVGGQILIIGGSAPDGASTAIYRFDPAREAGPRDRTAAAPDHPRVGGGSRRVRVPGRGSRERSGLSDRDRVVNRSAHRRRRGSGTPSRAAVGHGLGADRRGDRRRGRADADEHSRGRGRARAGTLALAVAHGPRASTART